MLNEELDFAALSLLEKLLLEGSKRRLDVNILGVYVCICVGEFVGRLWLMLLLVEKEREFGIKGRSNIEMATLETSRGSRREITI